MSTPETPKPSLTQRLLDTNRVPQDVKMSYMLWIIGAALSVIAALFVAFGASGGFAASIIGLLLALALAGLYVYCALRMKEGAGWARMVLTLLASLSAMAIVVNFLSGNFGFALLGPFIAVIATILMWSKNANPWFRFHSSARR